jgi:hypothetical protein
LKLDTIDPATPTALLRVQLDGAEPNATTATLREVLAQSRAMFDALIHRHHGRWQTPDAGSMVASFSHALDAVRCAVAIQQHLAALEAERLERGAADRRLDWRLAVGLAKADKSAAPGLSALVAALPPRTVGIAAALRDHLGDRAEFGFVPLAGAGDAPAAFRVLADPATAPRRVWLYETGTWHNAALVLVLLLLAAAIVVPLWHLVLAPAAP